MVQNVKILPTSYSQQQRKSPESINQQIERQIEANIGYFKKQNEESIRHRLEKLERTMDIDKAVKMNLVSLALITGILSLTIDKKWIVPSAAASFFFIQQKLSGGSIPYTAFRRIGFRTANENALERNALEQLLIKPH